MPVAAPSLSQVARLLNRVRDLIIQRLERYRRSVVLLTYEGTVLDRLAHHWVCGVWREQDYRVICSVRPCMHPNLIAEVEAFATRYSYPLIGFENDCSARYPWKRAEPRSCENVSQYIFDTLKGTEGLLLSSALLNRNTGSGFEETNTDYAGLYTFERAELARYRTPTPERNWYTLFLFEGLQPVDVVWAYLCFVSPDLERYHIPLCYLDCYNEQEQRKIIELVETNKEHMLGVIRQIRPMVSRRMP